MITFHELVPSNNTYNLQITINIDLANQHPVGL